MMKAYDLDRNPSCPREVNILSNVRLCRALMTSYRDFLIVPRAVLLEDILLIGDCLQWFVYNMMVHSSDIKALWPRAETTWSLY